MIGVAAPSTYLPALQRHEQVQLGNGAMDRILAGNRIPAEVLRANDFMRFYEERKLLLFGVIEKATGKKSMADADELEIS